MKRFARILMVWLLAAIFVAGLSVNVDATTDNVCPEGDGWVKADGLSGLTYTYTPPDGFVVTLNCMKVGDHPPLFGTGPTVTNTTLFNSPGGAVCTAPGVPVEGCALQGISHASFFLVPVTTTTGPAGDPEPTTTTTLAPPTTQSDTPTTLTSTTLVGNPTTSTPGAPTTTIGVAPTIISVPGNPTTSVVLATPSPEDTLPLTGVGNVEAWAALAALLVLGGAGAVSWKGRND